MEQRIIQDAKEEKANLGKPRTDVDYSDYIEYAFML